MGKKKKKKSSPNKRIWLCITYYYYLKLNLNTSYPSVWTKESKVNLNKCICNEWGINQSKTKWVNPSTNWASISIITSNETLRLTNFSMGHWIKQSEFEQNHVWSMMNQTKQSKMSKSMCICNRVSISIITSN